MQGYFSVRASQAAATGLTPFESKAGLKDIEVQINTLYGLTPSWMLEGQLGD